MSQLRSSLVRLAKRHPRLFDASRALSRLAGETSPVYECLAEYRKMKKDVLFLQVGSNDGISNDPIREFVVKDAGWQGCLVEPIPHLFEALKRNYAYLRRPGLRFVRAAVSDQRGSASMYRIKSECLQDFPGYADQIASFDRKHLVRHFPGVPGLEQKIVEVQVRVLTVADLAAEAGFDRVDLINLDVEGYESRILLSLPYDRLRPELILFESLHMSDAIKRRVFALLECHGFDLFEFEMDTVAKARRFKMRWSPQATSQTVQGLRA